ncbi:uncharacterized protein LOC135843820 [Planococcus citri]|uniref:uncharacterized protein LOC135843820 n=1 Tax=Planococcus citri TaxID=170843 RepID=UPI0031F7E82F
MNKRKATSMDEPDCKQKKSEDYDAFFICTAKSPPPLRDISAAKVALSLWFHEYLRIERNLEHILFPCEDSNRDPDYSEVFDGDELDESYIHRFKSTAGSHRTFVELEALRKRIETSVQQIPLPVQLREVVGKYPSIIERQLIDWLCYHEERLFYLIIDLDMINEIIGVIVWRPDVTIDYLSTARNVLALPQLKDIQRFRLMCAYCFEDEIKRVPGAISEQNSIGLTFHEYPLEYYWTCWVRDEMHKINIGDAVSVESYMLTRTRVNNWAAIEYFFDRLKPEEQVNKAKYLIRKYGIKFQTALLSKLNLSQRDRVLTSCSTTVIFNYVKIPSYRKYAMEIWNRYQNSVTSGNFCKLIDDFLTLLHNADIENDESKMKNVEFLFFYIWTNASNELRTYTLNNEEYCILDYFLFNDFPHPNIDRVKLITRMLSDAEDASKAHLFDQAEFARFCKILVKLYDASLLHQFLRSCTSDVGQISQFKSTILNSREIKIHCKDLIRKRDFDSLNAVLINNLPDSKTIIDYKKQILKFICISNFHYGVRDDIIEVIDKCLSNPIAAVELKKDVILHNDVIERCFHDINDGKFVQFKTVVELLFVQPADLQDIKIKLLLNFKNIFVNGTFSELRMNQWNGFVKWCLHFEVNMSEFKSSLPIDNIFADLLLKAVFVSSHQTSLRSKCNFENLNALLNWYFESKEEIKRYKINAVFLSKKINVIDTIIDRKKTEILKNIIHWCFENDQELITQFKINYSCHAIVEFL